MTSTNGDPRVVVIDASVVLKWALPETGVEDALDLLNRFETGLLDLIAPGILIAEVASALSRRCRRKQLTHREAATAFGLLESRAPVLVDSPQITWHAFDLSIERQLSFWDSLYLALAIRNRCDLVTADRRFAANAGQVYPYVRLIGNDPAPDA